jgi:hypothetical protein
MRSVCAARCRAKQKRFLSRLSATLYVIPPGVCAENAEPWYATAQ